MNETLRCLEFNKGTTNLMETASFPKNMVVKPDAITDFILLLYPLANVNSLMNAKNAKHFRIQMKSMTFAG